MSARAAWRLESLGYMAVYRYTAGKADWAGNGLPTEGQLASVPRIASLVRDVPTCRSTEPLASVLERLRAAEADLCVVINDERIVLGVLRGHALLATPEAQVEDVMDAGPVTYRPNLLVHEMAHHLEQTGAKRVLVTTSDGKLLGVLLGEDIEHAPHAKSA